MRYAIAGALATVLALSIGAHAQTAMQPTCQEQATTKKLAGAALKSFMTKCERDEASTTCNKTALEKKLVGAAKTSFTKKCVSDALKTK